LLSSFIEMINLLAFVSLPGYLITIMFSFVFWDIPLRPWLDRMIFFTCTQALIVNWLFFHLPSGLYLATSLATFTLLFLFFFQPIRLADRTRLIVASLLIHIAVEIASGPLRIQHFSQKEIITNSVLLLTSLWPLYAIIIAITLFMSKKAVHPGRSLHRFITSKRQNTISYLIVLLIVQFLLLIFLLPIFPTHENGLYFSLIFLASIFSLMIVLLVMRVISQSVDEGARISQQLHIEDVNQMFTAIRGQRHDFLNHAQVIHAMVSRRKYDELARYTAELIGEISEINEVLQIGHPALAALVRSKLAIALANKVEFRYQLFGLSDLSLGIKSIDVVKIIGNLIDNALDEASRLSVDERWIELHGIMDNGKLVITIRNPGRVIPEEDIQRIFYAGYSTKDMTQHNGIGLSIVKERVNYYNGDIIVTSGKYNGTEFRVEIPTSQI
jgi:signal transduction histidine kinase